MNPKNLPRADDPTGSFEITGATWNRLADMVEQMRIVPSAPITAVHIPGGTAVGVNINRTASLSYTKLRADWSTTTANVALGNACPDPTGANTTTNAVNICLYWPPSTRPANVPLRSGDVVAYEPFSGTMAGSIFGGGTNVIHGAAEPTYLPPLGLGTLIYQVYQMTGSNAAAWQYIKAHG